MGGLGSKAQAGRRDTSAVTEERLVTDLIRIGTLSPSPEQFPKNCQELFNSYKNQPNFSSLMTVFLEHFTTEACLLSFAFLYFLSFVL